MRTKVIMTMTTVILTFYTKIFQCMFTNWKPGLHKTKQTSFVKTGYKRKAANVWNLQLIKPPLMRDCCVIHIHQNAHQHGGGNVDLSPLSRRELVDASDSISIYRQIALKYRLMLLVHPLYCTIRPSSLIHLFQGRLQRERTASCTLRSHHIGDYMYHLLSIQNSSFACRVYGFLWVSE
jgi:hypothetical protein